MQGQEKSRLMVLAEEIVTEQNRDKFMELVREFDLLLEQKKESQLVSRAASAAPAEGNDGEQWKQLCARAAVERDPGKLLALVQEINSLLENKDQRRGFGGPTPNASARLAS